KSYDDELDQNSLSMPLDLVFEGEDITGKLHYWNKLFYNQLPEHILLNEQKIERICDILNMPKEKYRQYYDYWPNQIDDTLYRTFFDRLQLNFVQFKAHNQSNSNKYFIKINEKFWEIKNSNSIVLVNIINTYERRFREFEFY